MATIRVPVITEEDLGPAGLQELYKLASRRRREAREQVLCLVQYALVHSLSGDDVELTREQLELLFASPEPTAELVA